MAAFAADRKGESSMSWSERQRRAIEARRKNLLVSAAAGSGKTAVLVERVIQRMLDVADPLDIDRLLVVTFTNAAALEMRERIAAALGKELSRAARQAGTLGTAAGVIRFGFYFYHSFFLSVCGAAAFSPIESGSPFSRGFAGGGGFTAPRCSGRGAGKTLCCG